MYKYNSCYADLTEVRSPVAYQRLYWQLETAWDLTMYRLLLSMRELTLL